MTEETVRLDHLDSRRRAWENARDVLTVPQLVSISGLVQSAAVLDDMIIDLESKYEINARGVIIPHNWQQVMALADCWLLGFRDYPVDKPRRAVPTEKDEGASAPPSNVTLTRAS
jgi:hypothetical protein